MVYRHAALEDLRGRVDDIGTVIPERVDSEEQAVFDALQDELIPAAVQPCSTPSEVI
jgi:hypothetical protein